MFKIAIGILLGFTITSVVASCDNPFSFKKDSTDGEKRSGLVIYTDYGAETKKQRCTYAESWNVPL